MSYDKMLNSRAQAITTGLNIPSMSVSHSDANGIQMSFSQYSMDSEKMPQMQQQTNNVDFMDLDYKPSVCNVSQADGVMALTERGSSNNFQGPTGLMRYHSAPSSFFSSLGEEENNNIISEYFSGSSANALQSNTKPLQQNQSSILSFHLRENEPAKHLGEHNEYLKRNARQLPSLKRSAGNVAREDLGKHRPLDAILENVPDVSQDSFGTSQMSLMSQVQVSEPSGQHIDSSYQMNSVCCNTLDQSGGRMSNAYSSTSKNTLIRHSSSPAGLLSELVAEGRGTFESGFAEGTVRNSIGVGNSCGDIITPNRVRRQMNCLQQNSSPPGLLSQLSVDMSVPEMVDRLNMAMVGSSAENQAGSSSDDGSLGMQNGTNFTARKRAKELDIKMMQSLNNSDHQKVEAGIRGASALTNHPYSLPRSTSSELAMEEFLQDAVPCKVRAKRGCATHPRSIAERVRRTRISERMRKLQELVPNSDKQTVNIADMLDEAVEYVKSLQKQVQELTDNRDKCTCTHKPDCAYKT